MNDRWALFHAYLIDEITEDDFDRLRAWVEASPANAEQFMRFVADDRAIEKLLEQAELDGLVHGLASAHHDPALDRLDRLSEMEANAHPNPVDLTDRLTQRQRVQDVRRGPAPTELADSKQPKVIVIPRPVFWGGLAAALLVLALILWPTTQDTPVFTQAQPDPAPAVEPDRPAPAPVAVAELLDVSKAVWRGPRTPEVGQGLLPGQYDLQDGIAHIRFDNGAVTIIQAPATFTLDSATQLTLTRGSVVARCESLRSKGFVVQTPASRITDLGTAFSVEHDALGQTLTQVMQGEIEVLPTEESAGPGAVVLTTGQAAVVDEQSDRVRRVAYEPGRHTLDWDRLKRRPQIEGAARYLLAPPRSLALGAFEDDDTISVLLERTNIRLEDNLTVSFTEPGHYTQVPREMRRVLVAGETVDSYLLHMDVFGETDSTIGLEATARFDRPIVAVIVNGNLLTASDSALGHPQTLYRPDFRPAERRDARGMDGAKDEIILSDDRLTLSVVLKSSSSLDQVRVLVRSD